MTAPLRVAILSAAHVHTEAYAQALTQLPDTALTALWDDDPGRGQACAARHHTPFFASLDGTLWQHCDAVVIAAENVRHRALCEAACRAGKHVLCEKPLATSKEDAEAMIGAAAAAGVLLATAFPMRHSLPVRAAREQVRGGVVGEVLAVRAANWGSMPEGWFRDPALAGGGAVMDHTVHVVDLLRWYLDDEPEQVYAEISNGFHRLAVDDAAFLTIRFRSGLIASLDPSWSRPPSYPSWGGLIMELAGTGGTIAVDAFSQRVQYYPRQSEHGQWLGWGANADVALLADFADAIRSGRKPAADGRDGERALAVALAAYQSASTHQPVAVAPAG